MSTMPLAREVYYPESDGRPMGETQAHAKVMIDLLNVLEKRYASVPDVYVWATCSSTTSRENPGPAWRRTCSWSRGGQARPPHLQAVGGGRVRAWSSRSPREHADEDEVEKKGVYERLGVEEYFLFDPLGEYLQPRLQGYRLVRAVTRAGAGSGRVAREPDDRLAARTEGERLRLRDAAAASPCSGTRRRPRPGRPPRSGPGRQPAGRRTKPRGPR